MATKVTTVRPASGTAGISDAAVSKATGRGWSEWFGIIDKAGGRKMDHKGIVAVLSDGHGVKAWWRQMVAVAYEQSRGLREKHEKTDGYSISRSKTINVPVAAAFAAWRDAATRNRWLDEKALTIRKARPGKSIRITWIDRETTIEVNFYAKGARKCQVVAQHNKLADAKQAERMKSYWGGRLTRLKELLEAE